ncbi:MULTISPECIES: mandelate racemase/muconate lactonizing enzyme family protein [Roseomonadaceae]|uniref:Mandelate racemase/muconate lactonizing enzyme family protein n=1 Tax=Falsiroseomonas oleicola TaxID=2801474 RepID=A0ABS6H690_9PROT|nr:mandelate racemase/muconate lactonizing enzyme family protein [Roseomonas oleicola]MBU8543357.1 mandelate racemase/muconate lactonizing enzyme family protein [Roseomonas oleicola]
MKIASIQGFHAGFSPTPALGNASTFIRRRDFLLVRVTTESGVVGWGEVFASPFAAAALIRTKLAPLVLGQPVGDYGRIYQAMLGTLGYDRRGPAMMAASAIDMALHDAAARSQGISVAAMLGGALRDRALAYASGPFIAEGPAPYGAYPEQIDALLRRGFRAIKPRAGFDPRADGVMTRAMRRQVGEDIALMVDINQGYGVGSAIESARRMEEAGLLWIEEPLQPEDIPGYQTVARAVPCAIAGGEALASLAAFRDFLAARTFSVLQPDLTVCGGFTGFRKVAALADAYDLPVMPHVFGTLVNFHAALQMAALLPARRGGGPAPYPFMEYDATPNPLLTLLGTPELDAAGMVRLPEEPGIGLELDPERLAPWLTESWSLGTA